MKGKGIGMNLPSFLSGADQEQEKLVDLPLFDSLKNHASSADPDNEARMLILKNYPETAPKVSVSNTICVALYKLLHGQFLQCNSSDWNGKTKSLLLLCPFATCSMKCGKPTDLQI